MEPVWILSMTMELMSMVKQVLRRFGWMDGSKSIYEQYVSHIVWTGLTCHQSRPFTMASCSRDSTVRLWSLTPLITPLLLNIITDQPWEKITGNTGEEGSVCVAPLCPGSWFNPASWFSADTAMVPASSPLLCGKVSRDIRQELDKLSCDIRTKKLRWFSECFSVKFASKQADPAD